MKLNKSGWINNDLVRKRLDEVWKVEGDYFKVCFEEVVTVLEAHHMKYGDQIENRQFITRRYKDMIGAHGIGKTAINIGLCTLDAKKEKDKHKKTKDHMFGYITIANKVVHDFIDNKIDKNWLRKHCHLWLVIEVTKKEHDRKNILRSDQKSGVNVDYNSKLKLKHYKDVSDLHIKKDFKIRFKNLDYKKDLEERRANLESM